MSVTIGDLRHHDFTDPRRHDLDALRAFAMLLGIVLHGAMSFIVIPWAVQDRFQAPEYGLLVAAIHGFRMPLFFLLSGFFTAMLWRRRGLGGLLRHRAKRIALPLVLAMVTVIPTMWGVWTWAAGTATQSADAGARTTDTGKDIWTAAAYGNLDAVRAHVASGVPLDATEPLYGQSPLAWAVIGGQQEVVDYLLEAGADPNARTRDENTALHTAAFFGRAEAAVRLLEAGAAVRARNVQGETPLDSLRHDQGTTQYIAGLLQVPIDFDAVTAGRDRIRPMLEAHDAVSGQDLPPEEPAGSPDGGRLRAVLHGLMNGDWFMHLWFLWFLCWLVAGFALVTVISGWLPRLPIPRILVATPLCLLWLVPLTMVTQGFMSSGGAVPGFGADTSSGLVPVPHVLAHYAIFFGFGALLYASAGATDRLGRGWRIQLPLALLVLPSALGFALQYPWARELAGDESTRRLLANFGQVLYTWLMVFGLIGLFEAILNRERPRVRYVSDSSYWLYLVHLPLIIVGQALLRDVNLPAGIKLVLLVTVVSAILLVSYKYFVRYTAIGRLLNGPRVRSGTAGSGDLGAGETACLTSDGLV